MADLLHPGVYVSIVSSGVRPIAGVGTSTAAFVGEASRGIPGRATFLTSVREFEKAYGGQQAGDRGYLAQAVDAFFRAGGTRAYAVRVLPSTAEIGVMSAAVRTRMEATAPALAPKALSFTAKGAGAWSDNLRLYIEDDPINEPQSFRIRLQLVEDGVTRTVEDFQDLSMDPAAERYVVDVLERESQYVVVVDELAAWLDAGSPDEGAASVVDIPAIAPTLVSGALPATGVSTYEGAQLQISWWDSTTEPDARPTPVRITINEELRLAANALLAREIALSPPVIADFATGRTSITSATVLSALLRAGMATASATAAVVTAANAALEADEQLPDDIEEATPALAAAVAVTPVQLSALLTASSATPDDLVVGSTVAVAVAGSTVTLTAPFTTTANQPGFVESFDTTWISILETPKAGIGKVLPGLGFALKKTRGYSANSPTNPLARPVTNTTALKFAGGTDGKNASDRPSATDFLGSSEDGTGLHALDRVEVNVVAIPGRNDVDTLSGAIAYCDARGDCFYVADGPGSPSKQFEMSAAEARAFIDALPVRSNNAAMFFPWPQEPDPVGVGRNPKRYVPPSGLMAGVMARTDRSRGVWKAPAGIEAVVSGAVGVQVDISDADQDLLNPVGLNCVRLLPGAGIVVWGARTLASDPEWRYVPVRRTALFLQESIRRGMQWAVFEPNDDDLWKQIELNISSFMLGLFRQGAFQGVTPEEAFLVQCDRETNPQELVDQGIVTAKVQFAPLKPAEFVVIEISQKSLVGGS